MPNKFKDGEDDRRYDAIEVALKRIERDVTNTTAIIRRGGNDGVRQRIIDRLGPMGKEISDILEELRAYRGR